MELAKLGIPQKDVTEDERSVDSDEDFQNPPPKRSTNVYRRNIRWIHQTQ